MRIAKGFYKITFQQPVNYFELRRGKNVYYFRHFNEADSTCIGINHDSDYTANVPFQITPARRPQRPAIKLDAPERNRWKPVKVVHNSGLVTTPARIFTMENPARIETGKAFENFSEQVKYFILLHELGHLFYETEDKVDNFALRYFLKQGYNPSQAFYALSTVLKRSPQAMDRIYKLFNTLQKNNYV